MFDKRHSSGNRSAILRIGMVVLAAFGVGACGLTSGFIPGTGDVVGTFSHNGVTYTLQKDGTISRITSAATAFESFMPCRPSAAR